MKFINKIRNFITDIFVELRAVEWISRKQVAKYTLYVIMYTLLLSVSIFVIDLILVAARAAILDANRII